MRKLVPIILALLIFAQPGSKAQNYLAKGYDAIARGDYGAAISHLTAQKKEYIAKGEDANSSKVRTVDGMIKDLRNCQKYSEIARDNLSRLSETSISRAFENCADQAEVDIVKSRLLSTLNNAKDATQKILSIFKADKVAQKNMQTCRNLEARIRSGSENFEEYREWAKVENTESIELLEEFLSKFPDGACAATANKMIYTIKDKEAWTQASSIGTFEAYTSYLDSFGEGEHTEEAKTWIEAYLDQRDWDAARETGTSVALSSFIASHPSSKFRAEAEEAFRHSRETEMWNEALAAKTISAFDNYIREYPTGSYVKMAEKEKDRIVEADIWNQAVSLNTIDAYQSYLDNAERQAYKDEAEEAIALIKHQQEVEADEEIWARIANSQNAGDFVQYLGSSSYKGHNDEAEGKYNLYLARSIDINEINAKAIVNAYEKAKAHLALEEQDEAALQKAREILNASGVNKVVDISDSMSEVADASSLRISPYSTKAFDAYAAGNSEEASNLFEQAFNDIGTSSAGDYSNMYYAALMSSLCGQNERALNLYRKCYDKSYLKNGDVHSEMSKLLKKLGREEESIQMLNEGFANFPENQDILFGLINYYSTHPENSDLLFSLINQAKIKSPSNASLWYVEGNMYFKLGRYEEAINSYKTSSEVDKSYEFGYIGIGNMKYNAALSALNKAMSERKEDKRAAAVNACKPSLLESAEYYEKAFELTQSESTKRQLASYLTKVYEVMCISLKKVDRLEGIQLYQVYTYPERVYIHR